MDLHKEHKQELNKYIKENISKGFSIDSIKKAFIKNGYNLSYVEKLIKDYRLKRLLLISVPLFLILLTLAPIIPFISSNITIFTTRSDDRIIIDKVNQTFDQNADFIWTPENKGLLKSVKFNGEVKASGVVKVYLEYGNDTYLVFDSKILEGRGLVEITGRAINIVEILYEIKGHLNEEDQLILDSLIESINDTRNNVEIEIEFEENEVKKEIKGEITNSQDLLVNNLIDLLKNRTEYFKIKIESEFEDFEVPGGEINDTNVTIPDNGTINVTPVNVTINYTIDIRLEYKEDSVYDEDNDGNENIGNVIDFTVENTEFNWDVKEENLCTRWDTFSVEDEESTVVCYGSTKCCSFVDLSPTRSGWDDVFYSAYGQYGATLENIISSQVLYVEYNLSLDEPSNEIYYSDWGELSSDFYQGFIRFENVCIESCILPNLNSTSFNFVIEMDNSSLFLDSISYEILGFGENNPPILSKNFSNVTFFRDQSYTINLSDYFYDPDNDKLYFDYYNKSKVDVEIINGTAILSSKNPVEATFLFFIANDTVDTTVSNIFKVEVKKQGITFDIPGLKSLRKLIGLG